MLDGRNGGYGEDPEEPDDQDQPWLGAIICIVLAVVVILVAVVMS